MAQAQAALHPVAAEEAPIYSRQKPDESGAEPAPFDQMSFHPSGVSPCPLQTLAKANFALISQRPTEENRINKQEPGMTGLSPSQSCHRRAVHPSMPAANQKEASLWWILSFSAEPDFPPVSATARRSRSAAGRRRLRRSAGRPGIPAARA